MALPTNTFATFEAKGNREDLSDYKDSPPHCSANLITSIFIQTCRMD